MSASCAVVVNVEVAFVECLCGKPGVFSSINFSIPCPGFPGLYVSLRTLLMDVKYLTASSWLYCSLEFFDRVRRLMASRTCVLVEDRAK